jgi:hypothetical protein
MKGINHFRFNTATMREAMQEYLNKRLVGELVTVTDVTYLNTGNGEFEITVMEEKDE